MSRKSAPFPTKQEILRYIKESPGRVGKREIARAFGISGNDRVRLKQVLRELHEEGALERFGRRLAPPGTLPKVCVVEIHDVDVDGELLARPERWTAEAAPPRIYMQPSARGVTALGVGDRVLARLRPIEKGAYEGAAIRVLEAGGRQVLGVFAAGAEGGRIHPTDRKARHDYHVPEAMSAGARPGELVLGESLPGRSLGLPRAKVVERLGETGAPGSISLLAIHTHGIPTRFDEAALAEAEAAQAPALDGRTDLRDIPLVTIDGPDARDFDDAVWAEPDPDRPGGWHALVAIADVAHFVRPGNALDQAARARGNSVYFPDRVVPMLPEALSNGLCSLKPGEDRACLAAHLWLEADGTLRRHRFVRGLMRSAARLTYAQVQKSSEGQPDDGTAALVEPVIKPLYGAFKALREARARRGTLELELPERQVSFTPDGSIARIGIAPRYDSHKLIEEFMIAANVAAASTLEARDTVCMYRVHDQPDLAKLEALREFLAGLGLKLSRARRMTPENFNQILKKVEGGPQAHLVNTVILRAQAQAAYSPANIGHFGLALTRYAHFTSPIRRYADLLVHRALISALGLGKGGLPKGADAEFGRIGEHISATERRAALAERDAMDRYATAYLAAHLGAEFAGRVSGVTRFGVFVELDETGADGLIPASLLGGGRPHHDAERHCLTVDGARISLGDRVIVRLAEADIITGGARFDLLELDGKPWRFGRPPRPAKRDGKDRRRSRRR